VRGAAVLGAILFTACAPRNPGAGTAENAGAGRADDPVITLERTACFGGCPVYHLSVLTDGTVYYDGKAHVPRLGPDSARISPTQVQELVSEIEGAGYFSFPDRFTPNEPACGRYATDSPSVITSIRRQGKTKRIEHDYGCSGAPGALMVLEQKIDKIAGSTRWTGR
jgi:hypothetical protein